MEIGNTVRSKETGKHYKIKNRNNQTSMCYCERIETEVNQDTGIYCFLEEELDIVDYPIRKVINGSVNKFNDNYSSDVVSTLNELLGCEMKPNEEYRVIIERVL